MTWHEEQPERDGLFENILGGMRALNLDGLVRVARGMQDVYGNRNPADVHAVQEMEEDALRHMLKKLVYWELYYLAPIEKMRAMSALVSPNP